MKNEYKRTYTAKFIDKYDNLVGCGTIDFKWNIVNDPGLTINQYDNKIDIFLDNEDSIGSSFLLQILYDNKVLAELKITIIE